MYLHAPLFFVLVFTPKLSQDARTVHGNKAYIEYGNTKAGIFFTTLQLKEAASDYKDAMNDYTKVQSGLVKEIVNIACMLTLFPPVPEAITETFLIATYTPVLEAWNHNLAHLDVIIRFSIISHIAVFPLI